MSPRGKDWQVRLEAARLSLSVARKTIERLSDLAPHEADTFVCWAANTLRGSEALLREADEAFQKSGAGS